MDLIKPEMTPKERAKAYAAGDRVDRIPVTFSIGETIPPMYGYDICDYYFSVDAMVDVETRVAEDFQADNMGIGLGLRTMVEAMGTKMAYPKKSVSYIDKPLIDSLDQVDGLDVVDPLKDGRIPLIIQAFDRLQDRFGDVRNLSSGLAGPFTAAAGLFGTERLLRATRKDPEGVPREKGHGGVSCRCCRHRPSLPDAGLFLSPLSGGPREGSADRAGRERERADSKRL